MQTSTENLFLLSTYGLNYFSLDQRLNFKTLTVERTRKVSGIDILRALIG
jgi:hypothetical protein